MTVKRALLSVSDKAGIETFGRGLSELGVEIISTGGTAALLRKAGISVSEVVEVTGFPEVMGGRVKTLHPKIHGGLLSIRSDPTHVAAQLAEGIPDIDLLVVNLYPFAETVQRGAAAADVIENIDVGGPAMLRAAAKNHEFVTVIVDPADYDPVLAELQHGGTTSVATRRRLAAKVFARTAAYDSAIANWFNGEAGEQFPEMVTVCGQRLQKLRYGENPHQSAAVYASAAGSGGIARALQLQGKELSYNNYNDADAALDCVAEFDPAENAACVIVKHANPCGVAIADSLTVAYGKALRCDPTSAFGGIIAVNRTLDGEAAALMTSLFAEVIIAPSVTEEARNLLAGKKNLRVLICDPQETREPRGLVFKSVSGGFLVQSKDVATVVEPDLKVVTRRAPTSQELADLQFAFTVAKHVKSNAIVYAKRGATVGIGAGQMSRVDSSTIAVRKSENAAGAGGDLVSVKGSVVASDAFFPFADGLLEAIRAGATAVIQPGGSIRDQEIIEVADRAGIAMMFTGIRHFRH